MKATKIFVQNDTRRILRVQAFAENGEFLIVLTGQLPPVGHVDSVPPGNHVWYPMNDAVQACMGPSGLRYVIRNRVGEKVSVHLRRDKAQLALVFHITTESN